MAKLGPYVLTAFFNTDEAVAFLISLLCTKHSGFVVVVVVVVAVVVSVSVSSWPSLATSIFSIAWIGALSKLDHDLKLHLPCLDDIGVGV